jgi:acetyltransferase-like isoleucine patch superfamily enzyme
MHHSDNDGYPSGPRLRAQTLPPREQEIRPVRIRRGAKLTAECHVRKGVRVGEGAIGSTRSLMPHDIPDYRVAGGNPAKIVGGVDDDYTVVTRSTHGLSLT